MKENKIYSKNNNNNSNNKIIKIKNYKNKFKNKINPDFAQKLRAVLDIRKEARVPSHFSQLLKT